MKISKAWYAVAVSLCIAFGAATYARQLNNGLLVKLPNEVTVNQVKLSAGEYEIRKQSTVSPVFQFFNKDEMRYETLAMPINTDSNVVVEDPKVVMQKIGSEYYLTKIWLGGTKSGYEFPLPDRAKSLQRELEQAVPLQPREGQPLTSTSSNTSAAPTPAAAPPPAPAPAPAVQSSQSSSNAGIVSRPEPEPAVSTPQRSEPAPQIAQNIPPQQSAQASPPATRTQPAQAPEPNQDALPATASSWLTYLMLGVSLLTVSTLLYRG